MAHRLFIVEGLPCSGKSSISAYAASVLKESGKPVCYIDEGTGDHPADYEFHALAPAGLVSEEEESSPMRMPCKPDPSGSGSESHSLSVMITWIISPSPLRSVSRMDFSTPMM